MTIPEDKRMHLIGGLLFAVCVAALLWLGKHSGLGFALMVGSIGMGGAVELYQKVRHAGTPDLYDWAASSAPGTVIGAALELWLRYH